MLCVLPYLILDGNSPQSWMHSYLCSPSPRIGSLVPDLSSALMKNGTAAAAPAVRKVRRVEFVMYSSWIGGPSATVHYTPIPVNAKKAQPLSAAPFHRT